MEEGRRTFLILMKPSGNVRTLTWLAGDSDEPSPGLQNVVRTRRTGSSAFLLAFVSSMCWHSLAIPGETPADSARSAIAELLPILSYDTDTGFGYGVKVFALNHLGSDESFDLVCFNSTKGERWYRLVFSLPDFELRQGRMYPLALDLTIDYDKWIANSFFGVGNRSRYEDRETYTREPLEISAVLSRGFSPVLVVQAGLRYKAVRHFNFSEDSRLSRLPPALNASRVAFASLSGTLRYDTRDSYVNPLNGLVLIGEMETVPHLPMCDVTFTRLGVWVQSYSKLSEQKIVLATRLGIQALTGENLPVQVLLPVGGNNTVRGSPQDRFLDKVSAVGNAELRFPIFWRFGGVAGVDCGKVWGKLNDLDLREWATNPVVGLRFYMDTFVVRLDVGFGKEMTGVYLNFGQVF